MPAASLLIALNHSRDLAYGLLEQEFRQADMHGIGPSHAEIILLLQKQGRLTMQEIAAHIHRDKSTLTVLVNKLERKGFVIRVQGLADRRRTYIEPRPSAAIVEQKINKLYNKINRRISTCLNAKERQDLSRILDLLQSKLKSDPQQS